MNVKISIITPTFNRAHLLPRAIKSVLTQDFQEWELLIMDDGSTDETESVVKNFLNPKIRYYCSGNIGAGAQRNLGVEKANGNYIIFLDSDDWVEPGWLSAFNKRINEKRNIVVTCSTKKLDEENKFLGIRKPQDLGKFFENIELNFLAGALLLPKNIFKEAGGYDTSLPAGQHTDLLIRLLPIFKKYDVKIEKIDDPLVNILDHSGDKIRQNHDVIYKGNSILMKKHRKLFEKNTYKHFDFLSVTAVAAFKTGRVKEGKDLTKKALRIRPYSYLAYVRYIISRIPALSKMVWLK